MLGNRVCAAEISVSAQARRGVPLMDMRRRPGGFALAVLLVLANLVACSTVEAAGQADWTILIFMNGKNNLEPDTITNFNQIADIDNIPDSVNFLVELGRPQKHYTGSDDSTWYGVRRFLVRPHSTVDDAPLLDLGSTSPLTDMGNPASLKDFVDWGFTHYPRQARHADYLESRPGLPISIGQQSDRAGGCRDSCATASLIAGDE